MYAIRSYYERLVLMKGEERIVPSRPHLFLAGLGEEASRQAFVLMSALQRRGVHAEMDLAGKSLKARITSYNVCYTKLLRRKR